MSDRSAALSPDLDLDLVNKYAIAAPRYTSYPPANRFLPALDGLHVDEAIQADNAPGAGPVSLYLHLPFCASQCWYCGCHTIITRRRDAADAYLDDLETEIRLTASRMDLSRPVVQLHLGGGTPTFLTPEQLTRLAKILRGTFTFAADAEIGVEIDPRTLERGHIDALRQLGMNRASLGVQDTQRQVQEAIHRIQPHELNRQAVTWLREAGVGSINLDLIYGLPLQTEETVGRTLDDVLQLNPERLSLFSYAHVPWLKPAQRIFELKDQLPAAPLKLKLFKLLHERLRAEGYVDIGLDHFARPNDELALAQAAGTLHRNFQGYSTRAGASLYGFGLSSISQTGDTYRQNYKGLDDYRASLRAGRLPVERGYRLTAEEKRRRAAIMAIMCTRRIDFAAFDQVWGGSLREDYAEELSALTPMVLDGLVESDADGVRVTERGVPFLRVAAFCFDAQRTPTERRHASTV